MKDNKFPKIYYLYAAILVLLAVLVFLQIGSSPDRTVEGRPADKSVFHLNELGVVIDRPKDIHDLKYDIQNSQVAGPVLWMTTESLQRVSPTCYLGVFYKIDKLALQDPETVWDEAALKKASRGDGAGPATVKEFTDHYLVFEPGQVACSDEEGLVVGEAAVRSSLMELVPTARLQ
jgi:hypothetical protein